MGHFFKNERPTFKFDIRYVRNKGSLLDQDEGSPYQPNCRQIWFGQYT